MASGNRKLLTHQVFKQKNFWEGVLDVYHKSNSFFFF